MVSCAGLSYKNERNLGYLRIAADEHPLAVQSSAPSPRDGQGRAHGRGAGADIIDIDFGCPVRKVTKTGAYANCLDDPEGACAIVDAVATRSRSRSR